MMASKRKGKPVADILSKASQALAKSRQLRDSGKSNATSVYTKPLSAKTVAPASRIISSNLNYSSSDDDIEELDILASKSPSTFIEALDKYNAGMKSTRKVKNITVSHLGRESDLSAISSGTPSISVTFKSGENSNSASKSKKMIPSFATPIGAKPLNYGGQEIGRLGEFPTAPVTIVGDKELKKQESFEPLKLSSSDLPGQKSSNNNVSDTIGHPHETVAALMKRGDKVSEETYKVLQMMVKGSEAADAAFASERKDRIVSDSIDDLVLKTDASISLELEEDVIDEVPASAISENITYVGETMEDIVENLMSLDLEMDKKVELEEHPGIGVDGFDFKASHSVIIGEENNFTEEDEEESDEVTLKDVTYESDFELDQKSSMSRKSSLVKVSLQEEQDYDDEQNYSNYEEYIISANQSDAIKERSVTFSENKPRSSVSVEKSRTSKSINISRSEKSSIISPSKKSTRSSARDVPLVFYKDGSVSPSLSPEIENSSSSTKSRDKSFIVPLQPVGAPFSNPVSSQANKASSSRVKPSTSRATEKSQSKAKVPSQSKSQRVTSRSVFQDEEVENVLKLKSSSSRKSKERSKPASASKSRMMKSFTNPVNELMNIDGEKSTRHRQTILGILRKELYEKEVRRLTREQIKAESIKKKNAKKEKTEDYLKFLQFKEPRDSEELLQEAKEWYKMRNKSNMQQQPSTSIANEPGSSSRAFEIAQMMAMMEKLNDAARPSSYKKASSSTPRHNINFGAPYFTRSGDFAEGNFQPPERMQIPELVKDVLDSHHRMYSMTIDAAKRMGKKYKQLMKDQEKNEQRNQPSRPSASKKPAKA